MQGVILDNRVGRAVFSDVWIFWAQPDASRPEAPSCRWAQPAAGGLTVDEPSPGRLGRAKPAGKRSGLDISQPAPTVVH